LKAAALFIATGAGLFYYFRQEKQAVERRKKEDAAQAKIGRPKIGGPFELILPTPATADTPPKDVKGRTFTADDLLGSFSFIYFGFTNCPDICPEELDKMTQVVESVDRKHGPVINPVFITCDPARDSLAATAVYISEFHPRMVGLTGTYEAIKETCKAYRVYFSTPPGAEPTGDYLVDHSIFLYIMDPDGKFVDAFGRSVSVEDTTERVMGFIEKWKGAGNTIMPADAKERVLKDESRHVDSS
jgi:protein SCO1/2